MRKALVRYNPYKADTFAGKHTDPHIEAAMEEARIKTPKLYQRLKRDEAWVIAQRPIMDAMLEDPAIMAMLDDAMKWLCTHEQNQMTNELALLGIEAGATKREVRNAYRRKARKLHPDVGGDAEAFKQLHAAYRAVLKVTPNEQ